MHKRLIWACGLLPFSGNVSVCQRGTDHWRGVRSRLQMNSSAHVFTCELHNTIDFLCSALETWFIPCGFDQADKHLSLVFLNIKVKLTRYLFDLVCCSINNTSVHQICPSHLYITSLHHMSCVPFLVLLSFISLQSRRNHVLSFILARQTGLNTHKQYWKDIIIN